MSSEKKWDGRFLSYRPEEPFAIPDAIPLHTDREAEIDPITYEVVRHALWSVNEEHGRTIELVSGSPVALFARDFNTAFMTESGGFVFFGPYIQFLTGGSDLVVKWILENLGENPGIEEGDMFLANDPWIGGTHQPDVFIVAPVFVEGKIFAWTLNAMHQYDLGGSVPGSFCIDATEIYTEPTRFPPVKIVKDGEILHDVEGMYLAQSRLPDIVGLDLRAQIAGNNVARDRLLKLIERYGAPTVKAAMSRVGEDAERLFSMKLEKIPDGEWTARSYQEISGFGDRGVHRGVMSLRKEGDKLTFSNRGSDPQVGCLNNTFGGWRASVLCVLSSSLLADQLYALEGPLRHIEFDAEPGLINCATQPSSISCSGAFGMEWALTMAAECISKMLATSPELRGDMNLPGGHSIAAGTTVFGTNQFEEPFGTVMLDHLAGSLGAFPDHDGISTGGFFWDPLVTIPNVEFNEEYYPILYLYRREVKDGGGAGRYRGGLPGEMAFIPHRTEDLSHSTFGGGCVVPTSTGLFGGHPGCPNWYWMVKGSDVLEQFAAGRIPAELDELKGEKVALNPKDPSIPQGRADVYHVNWNGGGGFGDPLEREPEAVALDLELELISPATAAEVYGVVVGADGAADEAASAERRRGLRVERLRAAGIEAEPVEVSGAETPGTAITESLVIADDEILCGRCGHSLSPADGSYKSGVGVIERPIETATPLSKDPAIFVDQKLLFRQFVCPRCATQLETELALEGDPILDDVRIATRA
ncbi:MAG TPA: hydantoinase B/oxoprolinase family protein [Solirubrobacterales bacterium]|jgi:N-methylhydantoinase B|nr:hydantoinase B/oxoprolinase family protein [Solirubrobacterales bacterium]